MEENTRGSGGSDERVVPADRLDSPQQTDEDVEREEAKLDELTEQAHKARDAVRKEQ